MMALFTTEELFTALLGADWFELVVVLQVQLPRTLLQLVNHSQNFSAERCRDLPLLAFAHHVGEGEIDFAFDAFLNLPERAFTIFDFQGLGEWIDRSEPLFKRDTRVKIQRIIF